MEYQNIEIKIDSKGKVFLEVSGVSGKKCLELTKELEKSLGEIESREFKPEFDDEDKSEDNILTTNI
jgi:hypothetical protein